MNQAPRQPTYQKTLIIGGPFDGQFWDFQDGLTAVNMGLGCGLHVLQYAVITNGDQREVRPVMVASNLSMSAECWLRQARKAWGDYLAQSETLGLSAKGPQRAELQEPEGRAEWEAKVQDQLSSEKPPDPASGSV